MWQDPEKPVSSNCLLIAPAIVENVAQRTEMLPPIAGKKLAYVTNHRVVIFFFPLKHFQNMGH